MPAIRRTSLSRGTRLATIQRYTRAYYETDNQCETWYERIQNRPQMNVAFHPYRAAFNYNVEIDYSSQQVAIEPMNVKIKNEVPEFCCSSGKVKLTPFKPRDEETW